MGIEILGIYPIPSEEPVHLIEAQIMGYRGSFDFGLVLQPNPKLPESNWQVAWLPYLLSGDGKTGEPYFDFKPIDVEGSQRMAFFLHYTDPQLPLSTPFGFVSLPSQSPLPTRLNFVKFEPVD